MATKKRNEVELVLYFSEYTSATGAVYWENNQAPFFYFVVDKELNGRMKKILLFSDARKTTLFIIHKNILQYTRDASRICFGAYDKLAYYK